MAEESVDELTKMRKLHEAFEHFTMASQALEQSYAGLKERVSYLTDELEQKNRELAASLSQTSEAKDYLGGILESLAEAIIVVDNSGTVTMANRAAGQMMGSAPDALTGLQFEGLGIPDGDEEGEAGLQTPGGRFDVLISRSTIVDAEGVARGRVILLQDITRLKELEAAEERNHRLIAMGEMAAKIVHEIRSPLCSIELYASMLAKDLEGTRHTDMAQGISSGIRSLNNVLTNMLFFAKPRQPSLRPSDLGRVLGETVFLLKPTAEAQGVSLELSSGTVAGNAMCDIELMKQVLLNIILNAIQASPEGSTVRITRSIEDGLECIEVHDDGCGIHKADIARIFDPFFSTKDRGTGLGLAISARIMQAHGGGIRVQSEPGQGTSFFLSVPLEGTMNGASRERCET